MLNRFSAMTFPKYQFHMYPKKVTDKNGNRVRVHDADEEQAVLNETKKPDPVEIKAEVVSDEVADEQPMSKLDKLRNEAADLGVEVMEEWDEEKLRRVIRKAKAA